MIENEHNKLKRKLQVLLHSGTELLEKINTGATSIEDLEFVWTNLFEDSQEDYFQKIINVFKILYESSLIASYHISSEKLSLQQKERELKPELSYEEVANYLNCSISTIKRLVGENKLNPIRYNRKNVKITIAEIEKFKSISIEDNSIQKVHDHNERIIGGEKEFREELNSFLFPKTIGRATLYNYVEQLNIRKTIYTSKDLMAVINHIKSLKRVKRN